MGKVIAVCTSERKGIQKTSVPEIKVIEDWGIEGDAHALSLIHISEPTRRS